MLGRWFVVIFAVSALIYIVSQTKKCCQGESGREGFPMAQAQSKTSDFVTGLRRFGMTVTMDRPFILHVGQTPDVSRAIKDAAKRAGYGRNAPPQLVVTFVSQHNCILLWCEADRPSHQCINKSSPEYSGIKTACDLHLGVPSQNLLIQKVVRAGPAYWNNVALKVNVKLQGGVNHRIHNWLFEFDKTPTMVMGAE